MRRFGRIRSRALPSVLATSLIAFAFTSTGASATSGATAPKAARPTAAVGAAATPPAGRFASVGIGARAAVFSKAPNAALLRQAKQRGLVGPVASSAPRPARQAAPGAHVSASQTSTATITGTRSTFVVTFSGFDAPSQTAFTKAVQVWANQVDSDVPITVDAQWTNLTQEYGDPTILGSAGPDNFASDGATLYPEALANSINGYDLDPANPDIDAAFNSDFASWSFGDGAPGPNQEDFQSVVTHELGHGLGFISNFDVGEGTGGSGDCAVGQGTIGYAPPNNHPYVFDRLVSTGVTGGVPLVAYGTCSAALFNVEQSNNVYWTGVWGAAFNGNVRPKLYFPNPWSPGSSGSHLDETTYPPASGNALMTPVLNYGEVERAPGMMTDAMFVDLGWGSQQAFVQQAYQDFLKRPPTSTELAAGVPAAAYGGHLAFALNLTKSDEWLNVIIDGFYEKTLGRPADPVGLAGWKAAIRNGSTTIAGTAAAFYASDEYFQYHAGGSLPTWVDQLYQGILGRSQPAGSYYNSVWVFYAAAYGRQWVAFQIYQSQESRQARVTALYLQLLARPPDPTGLAGWAATLLTQDDLVLAANLANSAEYELRAQRTYLLS